MKDNSNIFFITMLFTFALVSNIFAQLKLTISTDKSNYEYGENIVIACSIKNITDSTFSVTASSSCQADFEFNDYYSAVWTICLASEQELIFHPNSSKDYYWTIDPNVFGLPNKNGVQKLIGHFFYNEITDSILINAPMFLGGQLNVGFSTQNDTLLLSLKDSLNIGVLSRNDYSQSLGKINETWQIYGFQIDSLYNTLNSDHRLNWVEYNRFIEQDSITVTSIGKDVTTINGYYLSDVYPNPFNSTSRFYLEIPKTENISLTLFNLQGKQISKIYNGSILQNKRYYFEIKGDNLASGIYFILVNSPHFYKTKKLILLK